MYEYKVFSLRIDDNKAETRVNELAGAGWRLLNATPYILNKKTGGTYPTDPEPAREVMFVFEREKTPRREGRCRSTQ